MATTLRKKSPFHCRRIGLTGDLDCLAVLSESDADLCPAHAKERLALAKKADAPIHPVAMPVIDESANWRPSGRTGPIWPI